MVQVTLKFTGWWFQFFRLFSTPTHLGGNDPNQLKQLHVVKNSLPMDPFMGVAKLHQIVQYRGLY